MGARGGGKRKENKSGNITLGGNVPSEKGGNSCNKTPVFQRSCRISLRLAGVRLIYGQDAGWEVVAFV